MESIWRQTCHIEEQPTLRGDIQTEVAVIGGGMAGILTAWQLQKAGVRTVVLEGNRIGSGQTQNTTAKITAQHGLICADFLKRKGKETAEQYFGANQQAVEEYERIIQEEEIDCEFEKTNAYVYSQEEQRLEEEVKAAEALGLPVTLERNVEIPVHCAGAVRFSGQGQFHPLKFLKALAEKLRIYEHTMVKEVEDHVIFTDYGQVRADKIIFAVHYPFLRMPGMYAARMHQERSYVLALEQAGNLHGMYIGEGKESYSFRNYGTYVLFGGQGHRTGENEGGGRYERLRAAAKTFFPESKVAACWSAQDCITQDKMPFIGTYAAWKPDWFVATGFQKWGMTSSMTASMLLRDQILGRENPYAKVFAPSRFSMEELPGMLEDGGKAVQGLARRFFQVPKETIENLIPGHGGILELEGEKAGVYMDDQGEVFAVDVTCPHLGCQLTWNPDEKTWDCPCHGSRFDYRGNLLEGPAQEGIGYA